MLAACSGPRASSESQSPSTDSGPSLPDAASHTPEATPFTPEPDGIIRVGTIVSTASAPIRLYPDPRAATSNAELEPGESVYVVDRDGEGSDAWFLVGSVPMLWTPDSANERSFGWIGPDSALPPDLEQDMPDCPLSPMAADDLQAMPPLQRLACYGDSRLQVTGVVPEPAACCGPAPAYTLEPYWLTSIFGPYVGERGLTIHFEPGVDLVQMNLGDVVTSVGTLDSPQAQQCVARTFPAGPDQVEIPELRSWAVLFCRTQFVVSTVEVTAP